MTLTTLTEKKERTPNRADGSAPAEWERSAHCTGDNMQLY